MTDTTPPGIQDSRPVWAVLLAGPVIGAGHFMAVYLLAEAVCSATDAPSPEVYGIGLSTASLVLTAAAAVVFVGAGLWSFARWRSHDGGHGRLLVAGVVLDVLFLVTVLFVGLPAAYLAPC